jgi:hypothetical protein
MKLISSCIALLLISTSTLRASHGQNFLLLEDYDLPAAGHGQILGAFDWERQNGIDSYVSEPNAIIGIAPWLAFGLTAHFADEAGEGWAYSSTTPRLYFRLPTSDSLPFNLGFSAGYQFAEGHDEASGHHEEETSHHDDHGHEGEAEHHEEETENDSGHSDHPGGIDNHDENLWHTRLLLDADLTDTTKLVLNFIGVFPESGSAAWGYGIGLRQKVIDTIALGLEARGDFDGNGQHELLAATYWSPIHDLTFRLGTGFGLTEETPDFILRTGIIFRF